MGEFGDALTHPKPPVTFVCIRYLSSAMVGFNLQCANIEAKVSDYICESKESVSKYI